MANTSAVIIWGTRDGEEALPVARPSDLAVVTLGAGRLLHQGYISAGCALEKTAGQFAHKVGFGPTATSFRIEKALGNDAHTRQSTLDSIYDSFRKGTTTQQFRVLKKECQQLLKYALPSQLPATQLRSLRSIIRLTTRYPGLRRVFLQSPDINKVAHSPDAICDLWRNTEYTYDRESRFTLEFAAHCLAGSGPCNDLEDIRPSELGCTRATGLGVLDILVVGYCNEGSGFPRLIAIRYLAGILELPTFWFEDYYKVHKHTMDKLCKQTLRLIEDINPDSVSADDVARLALLDPNGVDALAEAVLVGGGTWIRRMPRTQGLKSDHWFSNFVKLIDILRGLIISDFLPLASRRAAENWEDFLKDTTDQLPKSSSDWQYEDVYVTANGPRLADPSRSNWRPSDIPEESLHVDGEQPSALLKVFTTFRETLFRRTASKAGKTPPGSLTAEDVNQETYVHETSEGGTLVGETDEAESILRRPSFVTEHINVTNQANRSAAFDVQEQVTSSGSSISDETARENSLGPETLDAVNGMLAAESSHPADAGDSDQTGSTFTLEGERSGNSSSNHSSSDEQPDLGFNELLREYSHLQPHPRIPIQIRSATSLILLPGTTPIPRDNLDQAMQDVRNGQSSRDSAFEGGMVTSSGSSTSDETSGGTSIITPNAVDGILAEESSHSGDPEQKGSTSALSQGKKRPWKRSTVRKPTGLASAIAASSLAMANPSFNQMTNGGPIYGNKQSPRSPRPPYGRDPDRSINDNEDGDLSSDDKTLPPTRPQAELDDSLSEELRTMSPNMQSYIRSLMER